MMRVVRSAIRRPLADTLLVANAIAVHLMVIGGLRAVGLRRTRAWLLRNPGRSVAAPPSIEIEARVVWAVRTATFLMPVGRTCLTEALTAQHLLARRGGAAAVRFGVAKSSANELIAHAWLERGGRTIIGGETSAPYLPLARRRESV
jgi:transglutaminase superfamily protein